MAVDRVGPTPPFDELEAAITANATARRRDEFHTGRRLARQALAVLGRPAVAIPVGPHRAPVWPEGFVGSISHSKGMALAHIARTGVLLGIGVDLERDAPLKDGVAALVCRSDEAGEPLLAFVAKEAFYKAYFPLVGAQLDFQDVRVDLDPDRETFVASLVDEGKPSLAGRRSLEGRVTRVAGYVVGAVWVPRSE